MGKESRNGTCCRCDYDGESPDVNCIGGEDETHCNHWWEGKDCTDPRSGYVKGYEDAISAVLGEVEEIDKSAIWNDTKYGLRKPTEYAHVLNRIKAKFLSNEEPKP